MLAPCKTKAGYMLANVVKLLINLTDALWLRKNS